MNRTRQLKTTETNKKVTYVAYKITLAANQK